MFIAYLLASIWTLLLYHLRSEVDELRAAREHRPARAPGDPDPVHTPGPITSRFFWNTNGIAVGAFCLTLAIFFVTPRIGAGFFNKSRVEHLRTSGFSEQVDLSVIGSVKLDPSVVMRVEFPDRKGPVDERLYFRGAAYDVYNGRSWINSLARRHVITRTPDGTFTLAAGKRKGAALNGLKQEILLEPLDTPALFGVSFIDSVRGNFPVVQADGMGGFFLPYPLPARFQYSAVSIPVRLLEDEQTATSFTYPPQVTDYFLQVPELTPRVAELAREVAGQAGSTAQKVAAIERHLRESYAYSLDVGPAPAANPVEEFLFNRKTGYCEHYASAMVVMLRTLGIPARLATGFLAAEWNDFGGYYTVRQRDSHAWVEVYFPRSGWVTFDPTPAVPPAAAEQVWVTAAGRFMDSIQLKWDRFVIQYSFRDQMAVAQGVRERGDRVREQALLTLASATRWLAAWRARLGAWQWSADWALIGAVAAGLAVVAVAWGLLAGIALGRRSPGFHGARRTAIVRLYSRMLRLLDARGFNKAPGATPFEFARRVGRDWSEAGEPVARLTELYCRARFGRAALSSDDMRQAERLLAGLRAVRRTA